LIPIRVSHVAKPGRVTLGQMIKRSPISLAGEICADHDRHAAMVRPLRPVKVAG